MGKRFIENTVCFNVKGFDLKPGTGFVKIEKVMVNIDWEKYLLGVRPWFFCPVCGRRCKFLYYTNEAWSCRICQKLVYRSQWISKWQKLIEKEQGLLEAVKNGKPKWKHWQNYNLLLKKLNAINKILNFTMLSFVEGKQTETLRKVNRRLIEEIAGRD
jgi:hypothetical protein